METLLEQKIAVFSINPKQLDRFRDRHSVSGAKDDRRDAFVLGDSLRTDRSRYRELRIDDPLVIQLREMSRLDDEIGEEVRRLSNRLWEQLRRFWPEMLALCPGANEAWLWELLELASTPDKGARLTSGRVERLLKRHKIRRYKVADVVKALKTPPLRVATGTIEAACTHIAMLLPRLKLAHTQRHSCEKQLEQLLADIAHDEDEDPARPNDVQIVLSFKGIGTRVAAAMFSEAHQAIANRDYDVLRSHSGIAPVTCQSGKSKRVRFRYGCNLRLRTAVHHWSRVCVQNDERARIHYDLLRGRGHNNARALRGVGDRLINVLVAMLRDRTCYDPARRVCPQIGP